MAKKKEEPIKELCATCNVTTKHTIVHEENENFDEDYFWEQVKWQIIQCDGCGTFSFRYDKVNQDDLNEDAGEYEHTTYLYPNRGLQLLKFWSAPLAIRSMYEETINAFNSGFYVLCGAGVRIVIERICAHIGVESGKVPAFNNKGEAILEADGTQKLKDSKFLDGKISGLHESKYLTESHSKALQKLRFIGNASLHSQTPKLSELKTAIKIIEHTLESLYELADRADEIRDPKKKISTKNI
jgi:hypothetical protein